jgi:hypothetical protein
MGYVYEDACVRSGPTFNRHVDTYLARAPTPQTTVENYKFTASSRRTLKTSGVETVVGSLRVYYFKKTLMFKLPDLLCLAAVDDVKKQVTVW